MGNTWSLALEKCIEIPVLHEYRRLYDLHIRGDIGTDWLEQEEKECAKLCSSLRESKKRVGSKYTTGVRLFAILPQHPPGLLRP